ncbi:MULTISPECIES: endonuclease/exonuclease/phosphatase family protein [Streptomyces]|uniref:Endonuclease/exonuclease/phosphatase family protein n=1 Tax=Streptomyces caniscabiei TaxID=2746961 RepID=A0ABU4MFC5_9ACTN|nr:MULTISPECIES: endonuclease/exonuclease/phosphatase family protein [Streptomyces]MBE4736188.1 endonuclease/exonuclease/phosphatase family protein [Streptomyces caniscabiei]MBE4755684.1 endonuclease/exonuclease/phosphatase family protein [Streptomyces caniscabiei]MBE4771728.1 endonuclease/exonuclease/phosphatase family protein [Streptomyces caniscabiei]MBE4785845.1 endonuclease/exonuclease/phosphatase family protein [Streptomyces caniscabiei]MBE4793866.1 endonuclease/exonuclease/phosphatase f
MPSKRTARIGALTVATICSTVSAVVLTSPAVADSVRIHDIQGTTRTSPLAGQQVTGVEGIVTGVRTYGSRGFWIQDTKADADPATSEGVFVFTSSRPTVSVGDAVTVAGTVSEFVPGGTSSGNQSVTQITRPTITVVSTGNAVPAATVVNARSVPSRYAPTGDTAAGGSVNGLTLAPATYALDYYESLEGMNVQVADARVVGATDPFTELWVTVKPRENADRRGGTVYGSYTSQNTGRLQIQSLGAVADFPKANVGDVLKGTTAGPLDYNQFGGYTLVAGRLGTLEQGGLERETTRKQGRGELAVATYNVENLDPSDASFADHAAAIVHHLQSPDIVTLEEIQDNNGATNDGTVAADQTVKKLIEAISAAGGPTYDWRSIDPVNLADGGEPGGNIRQVFLFNPERVSFTDRAGGDATTAVGVTKAYGKARLTVSPGRIDPANAAWTNSRKPLVGEFSFRGKSVFVIANHFASKGGDQSLHSEFQPPKRSSETQRHLQATAVNTFVKEILAKERNADVIALGDINDFEFSKTAELLEDDGALWSAVKSLPRSERYSYVFQGNTQVLDQILISPSIRRSCDFTYDSVHTNAEFHDQISDHDPQVLRFKP